MTTPLRNNVVAGARCYDAIFLSVGIGIITRDHVPARASPLPNRRGEEEEGTQPQGGGPQGGTTPRGAPAHKDKGASPIRQQSLFRNAVYTAMCM